MESVNFPIVSDGFSEIPRHGYRGELFPDYVFQESPGPNLCISREFGARGGSIGRKVARKLGWQVYNHEILQYMVSNQSVVDEIESVATSQVKKWVDTRWESLLGQGMVSPNPALEKLARLLLTLGYMGKTVFVGAGAGFLLSEDCRLHARIISRFEDRAAYISQYDRSTRESAIQKVRSSDEKRISFVRDNFPNAREDYLSFDLILNSSALGEDCCVQTIVQAIRGKFLTVA